MLDERPARRVTYDAARNVTTLELGGAPGPFQEERATLLLDPGGLLVGVDLRDGRDQGIVVMLGAHEEVAETRGDRVRVARDAAGAPAAIEIRATRARGAEMGIF